MQNKKNNPMCNRFGICWIAHFFELQKQFKSIGYDKKIKRIKNLSKRHR